MIGSSLIASLMTLFLSPAPMPRAEMMTLAPEAKIIGYFEIKQDGKSFEYTRLATATSFPFDSDQDITQPTQITTSSGTDWDYTLLVYPSDGAQLKLRIEKDNGTAGRAVFSNAAGGGTSGIDFLILRGNWPVVETTHTTVAASGVVIVLYPFQEGSGGSLKQFERLTLVEKLAPEGICKARHKTVSASNNEQLALVNACVAISSNEVRHSYLLDDKAVEKIVTRIRGLGIWTQTSPP